MYVIVIYFEQLCWWGKGSGAASHILILLNFMNIAKRRSFSATSQASDALYRQHVTVIERNKRPVERTIAVVRRTVAHCCENIASLMKKFNLPMRALSLKFPNCAMRSGVTREQPPPGASSGDAHGYLSIFFY